MVLGQFPRNRVWEGDSFECDLLTVFPGEGIREAGLGKEKNKKQKLSKDVVPSRDWFKTNPT